MNCMRKIQTYPQIHLGGYVGYLSAVIQLRCHIINNLLWCLHLHLHLVILQTLLSKATYNV